MATVITAIFDNMDMAELAIRQIRSQNIPVHSFHTRPVRGDHPNQDIPRSPAVFTLAFQNSMGALNAPAFLPTPMPIPNSRELPDTDEAILVATIPDSEAGKVKNIMINANGRRVRGCQLTMDN